jgi:hypothetical protein
MCFFDVRFLHREEFLNFYLSPTKSDMKKIPLGLLSGSILGLLDGLSAFMVPEAAGMMTQIIIGSAGKGLINGLIAGAIARKAISILNVTLLSGLAGLILSVLSAIPSGAYLEIVAPGTIVGLVTGFITAKWGK